MKFTKIVAGSALAAILAGAIPAAPALANGAASTRNIIFGAAAATYLIIQHNRKVHQRYAEDARRQAAAQSQANDAWAAYSSEKRAYDNEVAVNSGLQKEVAYQHSMIKEKDHQLAMNSRSNASGFTTRTVAVNEPSRTSTHRSSKTQQVAMADYGWGRL
ncbi:MAG TPA: hypothetical protein VIG32_05730 [Candidatus Baltobacteraceae bacterium]|jgi:uncharacterized protein YktB (UPF0637 family)